MPTDRGIISGFRRKVGFDLCFTGRRPLFEENWDFQMTIYLIRSIVDTVGSNYSIVSIVQVVQIRFLNNVSSVNVDAMDNVNSAGQIFK